MEYVRHRDTIETLETLDIHSKRPPRRAYSPPAPRPRAPCGAAPARRRRARFLPPMYVSDVTDADVQFT
eukprot:scaffold166592_cov23-Tisochrysis_lutea.AAC.1